MSAIRTLTSLSMLVGIGCAADAADLSKVDRSVGKWPKLNAPKYCLLVFGPDAKARSWLIQDGDTLYVDRKGDSDLTAPECRVEAKQKDKTFVSFEAGKLAIGGLTHDDLTVTQMRIDEDLAGSPEEFQRLKGAGSEAWVWNVGLSVERPANDRRNLPKRINYVVNGDSTGWMQFADRPENAPVIHFNAPWTMAVQDKKQKLTVGRASRIQIGVGTPGVGPGTFAFVLYPKTIPNDVFPQAEIAFPPNSLASGSLVEKYTLKSRC